MNKRRWLIQSLRYYWRLHVGVVLGAAISAAVITGALIVGDSVRASLKRLAMLRLGKVEHALFSRDRFVRTDLAAALAKSTERAVHPVLYSQSVLAKDSDEVYQVETYGVEKEFWDLSPSGAVKQPSLNGVALSANLAASLGATLGDEVIVRIARPSLLPREVPLVTTDAAWRSNRFKVEAILSDDDFGRFGLSPRQTAPYNCFLSLKALQKLLERPDQANLLLTKSGEAPLNSTKLQSQLDQLWTLDDVGLKLKKTGRGFNLVSERVFLSEALEVKSPKIAENTRVLTYFVNGLKHKNNETPYSFVAAMEEPAKWLKPALKDDEIFVHSWLANDLKLSLGSNVTITYFVLTRGRRLKEESKTFKVRAIAPINMIDSSLMPEFPGLTDKENCSDWDSSLPVDMSKIKDEDNKYWEKYRGTPKALITLKAGQEMWKNRYGALTTLQFPGGQSKETITQAMKAELNAKDFGLQFISIRSFALAAAKATVDFGGLFIGLSFFLIFSALLLTSLLFIFGIESRFREAGTFLALGFTKKSVKRLMLTEGSALALIGTLLGSVAGIAYASVVLYGLKTLWTDATRTQSLILSVEPVTIVIAALISFVCALGAMSWAIRKQLDSSPRELLQGGPEVEAKQLVGEAANAPRWLYVTIALSLSSAIFLAVTGLQSGNPAGFFFGAGAMTLLTGLAWARLSLQKRRQSETSLALSLNELGQRGATRRPGRSLAAIALLSIGMFMVVAVGANRKKAGDNSESRSSGTGGFALYAKATLPVYHDLNSPEGRQEYDELDNDLVLKKLSIVPLRVREGDDASCLNLNRVTSPTILGVNTADISQRKAFPIGSIHDSLKVGDGEALSWNLLKQKDPDGAIPAFADMNTILWALGKSLGDVLEYKNAKGQIVKIRLAGSLGNTVLQGQLVIANEHFENAFPSVSGYQLFLIDGPRESLGESRKALAKTFQSVGLKVESTEERLAAFLSVENTYLSIFLSLGGLALILGSFGLGVIVLRNVLERQGELALMRAVGYSKAHVKRLVFVEHQHLVGLALRCGLFSALVTIVPAVLSGDWPWFATLLTMTLVTASAFLWVWLATQWALRGPFLDSLRRE
ncbi:MAG: FtsX-like permease family protein [Planctomycetota bacterium]|nr:FtsX-like permease family protein [Planctomycetota bacterium]